MLSLKKTADRLFIPCIICAYLMVLAVSYIAKTDPWIWYDEAAQFWIGKGLNLDSPPLSPEGGIKEVIANNHDYNLDPGGLGIIIHFWEKVSCHYLWLRALPFLFFILTLICSAYLGYKWTGRRNVAMLMAQVPCAIPLIYNEAFEIRAYSMEVLGVYLTLIGLMELQEKLTLKRLVLWSCIISIFLTSRYAFIPIGFVASLYVLYLIFRSDMTARRKIIYAVLYAIPLFFTLFAIYMMAMRVQNPGAESLGYLIYLRHNPEYLIKASSACYLLLPAFIVWLYIVLPDKTVFQKHRVLIYMLFASTAVCIILSFLGFLPWIVKMANGQRGARWCISLIALATISISAIACEIDTLIHKQVTTRYLLVALLCFQFIYNNANDMRHFRDRDTCLTEYQSVMTRDGKLFIDRSESPAMRYQFEYGALKGTRNNYPEGITFTTADKHCINEETRDNTSFDEWYQTFPELNDLMQYDMLIVPELKSFKPEHQDKWKELGNKGVFVKKDI